VFVTHDQEEAMEIADRIVVMKSGRIEQVGSPDEVYHAPATPFVAEFLGDVNKFTYGRLAYARPYEIEVHLDSAGEDYIPAKVEHVVARGPVMRIELVTGHETHPIEADLSRERLILSLESLYEYETGVTPPIIFGPNRRVGAAGAYILTINPETKEFSEVGGWVKAH
jgi:ABC-type sulfate/molybdate transport systems ATPase subunit